MSRNEDTGHGPGRGHWTWAGARTLDMGRGEDTGHGPGRARPLGMGGAKTLDMEIDIYALPRSLLQQSFASLLVSVLNISSVHIESPTTLCLALGFIP